MKIPESIIEKYKLAPSGIQTGESLVNDLILYKSALSEFGNILFMECDMMGKLCKDICFYNRGAKRDGTITPEFMEDAPIEVMLKIVS